MNTEAAQAHCIRCHRALHSAASIAAKAGRWCRAKIRAAAIAEAVRDFKDAQVDKARELIADGGIIRTSHRGVFRTVSSKGDATYLTHSAACNCPAGLRSRSACYHVAAVRILTAGRAA